MGVQSVNVGYGDAHDPARLVSRRMGFLLPQANLSLQRAACARLLAQVLFQVADAALQSLNQHLVRFVLRLLPAGDEGEDSGDEGADDNAPKRPYFRREEIKVHLHLHAGGLIEHYRHSLLEVVAECLVDSVAEMQAVAVVGGGQA